MKVLLDSNFVICCIVKKIDFIEQLAGMGFEVFLPKEVYEELKDLRFRVNPTERKAIDVAMELFAKRKLKKIDLSNCPVDEGLIKKGKLGYYIATLDNGIRRQIPNRIIISSSTNCVEVERE